MLQEATSLGIRILNEVDVYDRERLKSAIESLDWNTGVEYTEVLNAAKEYWCMGSKDSFQ
jgi:hypothetical protein